MVTYTNVMSFLLREFVFGLVVAVVAASVIWLFMSKGYKRHYWLLTFFPAAISSKFPDVVIVLGALLKGGMPYLQKVLRHPGISVVYRMVHSPILAPVLTTTICISMVLLWSLFINKKTVLPRYWKWYVTVISCVSVLIEILVLDPLPF